MIMETGVYKDMHLDAEWKTLLSDELNAPYFEQIHTYLRRCRNDGQLIFPPESEVFNAFNYTSFSQLKVVVIGQDPYHGQGQAHGLCFSVKKAVEMPPSLLNIFKELQSDLSLPRPAHGNLTSWAKQGVLLLNAVLTVRANEAASHQQIGWQRFTDSVIRIISDKHQGIIFLLWGRFAHSKEVLIDANKHFILKAAHPSPLSAFNGFFGCRHFSKTNEILKSIGREPINWVEDI